MRSIIRPVLVAIGFSGACGASLAHGGGLDASGCHHNRKTGDYHCHRAPAVAPRVAPAAVASPPSTTQARPAAPVIAAPVCHVGPRGGTYTITASGRKNYGGC